MTGNSIPRASSEVKALRVVLITLLLLYGVMVAVTLVFMARVFPSLADLPSGFTFHGQYSLYF